MLAPVIEGLRDQPALGPRRLLRSTSKAGRWGGVPYRRHARDRQWRRKWSGRCGGGWTSSQIGVAASPLLVAKHKYKAGGRPSLHNECLRALTTKPKKTCWVRTSSQMRRRLTGTGRQNA